MDKDRFIETYVASFLAMLATQRAHDAWDCVALYYSLQGKRSQEGKPDDRR
jgi:hypothetical protein